jgi:hypothetical protein
VVGKNLHTGADDEGHEEQVEEVQQPEPAREPCRDRVRRGRDARIARQEFLHACGLPQRLANGDAGHEQHEDQRHGPKDIDPMTADPNLRHHAGLRRQPVAQQDTVVGGAQLRGERVMRPRQSMLTAHARSFVPQMPRSMKLINAIGIPTDGRL